MYLSRCLSYLKLKEEDEIRSERTGKQYYILISLIIYLNSLKQLAEGDKEHYLHTYQYTY